MSSMWNERVFPLYFPFIVSIFYGFVCFSLRSVIFCVCAWTSNELGKQFSHSVVRHIGDLWPYLSVFISSFVSSPPQSFVALFPFFSLRRVSHLPKLAFQQIPSNPHHEYWLMSVHYNTSHLWMVARLCVHFLLQFFRGFHKVECNTRDQVGKSDL